MSSSFFGKGNSSSNGNFTLEEKVGDLFVDADQSASLAHCVSQCLSMSKGIAVEFKKRFSKVVELKAQNKVVGDMAVLSIKDGRYIYYLVTKSKYWGKPTYATLEKSLREMHQHIIDHKVPILAMPKIGCGLDRLDWDRVKQMLHEIFADVSHSFKIQVFTLPHKA